MCVCVSILASKGSFSDLIFEVSQQGDTALGYLQCPMKLGNQAGSRSWSLPRTCSESTIFIFSTCIMARWPSQKPPMPFMANIRTTWEFPITQPSNQSNHRRLAVFQVCVCVCVCLCQESIYGSDILYIWRFPKIGIPQTSRHIFVFDLWFWGSPSLGNTHINIFTPSPGVQPKGLSCHEFFRVCLGFVWGLFRVCLGFI